MGGRVAFEVDGLYELVTKLKKDGVQFELEISSSPVCQMAIVADSEGNQVIPHKLENLP